MKKRGLESPDTADALMLTFTGTTFSAFPIQQGLETSKGKPFTAGLLNEEF